jgi:hypothetical protein
MIYDLTRSYTDDMHLLLPNVLSRWQIPPVSALPLLATRPPSSGTAEHLPPKAAETLVSSLVALSPRVLFPKM